MSLLHVDIFPCVFAFFLIISMFLLEFSLYK